MQQDIRELLEQVRSGDVSVEEAELRLKLEPFEDLGYAKVDMHRRVRQGAAEVIYGASKTPEQIAGIAEKLLEGGQAPVLVTRLRPDAAAVLAERFPSGDRKLTSGEHVKSGILELHRSDGIVDGTESSVEHMKSDISENSEIHEYERNGGAMRAENGGGDTDDRIFTYYSEAQIGIIGNIPQASGLGKIVVATGGTSDIPVAEEAALTAEVFGNEVVRLYDVGVAGLHRLLAHAEELMSASVVIAIAGMEGALASVIGGLVDCPVIAVPTSVGYGASFGGLSALLSMLNSCASGVSVVNIDNGFGAGYLASRINHMAVHP